MRQLAKPVRAAPGVSCGTWDLSSTWGLEKTMDLVGRGLMIWDSLHTTHAAFLYKKIVVHLVCSLWLFILLTKTYEMIHYRDTEAQRNWTNHSRKHNLVAEPRLKAKSQDSWPVASHSTALLTTQWPHVTFMSFCFRSLTFIARPILVAGGRRGQKKNHIIKVVFLLLADFRARQRGWRNK